MVFINIFFKFLSLIPFLSVTRDENYGYNDRGIEKGLRISVVNLRLGRTTYYFLTYSIEQKKFKLKEKLILDNCQWAGEGEGALEEKDSHIEKLSSAYADKHLVELPENEKGIEKEFLGYLIDNLTHRKSLSYNKMNYYTTIILVFIPLAPTFLKNTFSHSIQGCLPLCVIYVIAASLLIYAMTNWCLYAIQYMSVTGIQKSSFRKLKELSDNRDRLTQQIYSYYHDWQEERFDTNLRVAYVKETELIVKCAAGLLVILTILPMLPLVGNFLAPHISDLQHDGERTIYSFNIKELENPFSADSLELAELHVEIKRNEPKALLVLVGVQTDAIVIINNNMLQYEKYIKIETYVDSELPPFEFKVALLRG